MKPDIHKLSRDWFERVWNKKDESAIADLASPDVIVHGLDESGLPAKLDSFIRFYRAFKIAFPDLRVDVEDILVEGDKSAVRIKFYGTHKGDGIGIPPTKKLFTATGIVIMRWAAGQIAEAWNEFDAAGMMRQLQAPGATLRGSN